jgi:hypothetical protein
MMIPYLCALGLIAVVGIALLLWIIQAAITAEDSDQNYLSK